MKPWEAIIPQHEQEAYRAAGFGRRTGLGSRPALLIIDVQYRTVGTEPRPFFDAIKEFPTACGQIGWDAVHQITRVLALFRAKGVVVGQVLHSQWCRTRDTARLAFGEQARPETAFNSYFGNREVAPAQNARARELLRAWKGPGALVVVTHQVNIQALADVGASSAEGVVLRPAADGTFQVVGSITP